MKSQASALKKQIQDEKDAHVAYAKLRFPPSVEDFEELHRLDQQDALQVAKYLVHDGSNRNFILAQAQNAGKLWTEGDITKLCVQYSANVSSLEPLFLDAMVTENLFVKAVGLPAKDQELCEIQDSKRPTKTTAKRQHRKQDEKLRERFLSSWYHYWTAKPTIGP